MKQRVLGLDLGTSSIGWSLIELSPKPDKIIDMGVRIFPEGVDRRSGEKSLNQNRTDKRSLRRQGYRRVRRKRNVLHALQEAKLLPYSQLELDQLFQATNPYKLRSNALFQKIKPYELGRALYHLGQRRGYLSNRKTGNEKDDGKVAEGIGEIDTEMKENNFQTLGHFLNNLDPRERRIRNRYTARRMYLDEFDAIWRYQQRFHTKSLTEKNRRHIHKAIFHQRPLKVQKFLVGHCEFESGRKRAMAATLAAQDFRLWQSLNDIKVLFADGIERFLTDEERLKVAKKLSTQKKLTWERIRKLLDFYDDARFNLEKVHKSGLQGNQTAALIASALGKKQWNILTEKDRENLTFDLLNIESEEGLKRRLRKHWCFDDIQINKLLKNSQKLAKGYMHLSHKAIRTILPYLKQVSTPENKGMNFAEACEAAGYHHSQKKLETHYEQLPFPGKLSKFDTTTKPSQIQIGDLRNPMVERALYQLRKVVNAIIRKYGKPDIIRVEMARDLKANSKQRENYKKQQDENETKNKEANKVLVEYGINPSHTDLIKYRLWIECNRQCPYTGKVINHNDLFGAYPQFDVEHIIPYSRCLDNSYMNKTLCYREENERKGKFTPWELYHSDEQLYEEIRQRAKTLPYPKFKRFVLESLQDMDEFVSQQLNETRYISRKAVEYLQQLKDVQIDPVKGGTTALLRRAWGLNNLLSNNGEKNRSDHRHHAVDALVVAMTDRNMVRQLNRWAYLTDDGRLRIDGYPVPMSNLRQKAQDCVNKILISHKSLRKVKGALHEDTLYGITGELSPSGIPEIVIRKKLAELTENSLKKIRDPRIRRLAFKHFENSGKNYNKAFKNSDNPFGFKTKKGRFQPIRKVRIVEPRSIRCIGSNKSKRHVWTRSNHHMEIIETKNKKGELIWKGLTVSMLDASLRAKQGLSIINRNHGTDKRFICALHINDMVKLTIEDREMICRIQSLSDGDIELRRHTDSSKDKKDRIRIQSWSALRKSNLQILNIDMLGKMI